MRVFIILFTGLFLFVTSQSYALEVSPDGPKIINLSDDATSVIVGNPNHASVVLDSPRRVIVNAGEPGSTRLTILGDGGQVLFNDHIVVSGPSEGYVRVRNACINGGDGCQEYNIYQCEGNGPCHDVSLNRDGSAPGRGRR